MISTLSWYDHRIFEWVQYNLHGSFLDTILVLIRDKFFWIPLYLAMISWVYNFHRSLFLWIIGATIFLIALTDQISSNVLKKKFQRVRPCREQYFSNQFEVSINCSSGFSFPSSHASNHSAIGVFYFCILGSSLPRGRYFLLFWPALIGFCQVFVGVHFPFDVLAGLTLGTITGLTTYFLYRYFASRFVKKGNN
ncbi:MAG: phosphatase PAP2 family protein [Saprospiraceae bacterium]|nr:phosphatase PAP2 family protein [Saprospiraceae bacterium]